MRSICSWGALFESTLPEDWRDQWKAFVVEQEGRGYTIDPNSVLALEKWIEAWAVDCDLMPIASAEKTSVPLAYVKMRVENDQEQNPQPGAAASQLVPEPLRPGSTTITSSRSRKQPGGPRGKQSQFAREAEEIVSEVTGVPRNSSGPRHQTIPGSGPAGVRFPDLKVRGPEGSVRIRGTVIEVKASTGSKFGDLSQRSREQIEDAVLYVIKLREKANLVKDPGTRLRLKSVVVEVFTDLPKPKSGRFFELIESRLVKWSPIPRSTMVKRTVTAAPSAIGRPGIGTSRSVALGILTALVEAKVANETYTENAGLLNDLLSRIERDGQASEADWKEISSRIDAIAKMKQSALGYVGEFISYGQGSLIEQQGMAMAILAGDLAEKFGYRRVRTWTDLIHGGWGTFQKT